MSKSMKTRMRATYRALLLLGVGLTTPVGAGELTAVVEHYDAKDHRLYIAGKPYQLSAEAEAELLKAQPGIRGFVGQAIEYSATEKSDGYWIELLKLIE